ncbi:hypothetical protein F3Y22_tig00110865pilonHSYRG00345 [Hibiscus syriacus]|uniref:Uncharacterized protein n=1 Tax=Hibiscus syriacus TaxID=106335 RepID=A0A6A2ZL64_HIBSY|nr:hypothetical protein F3Y22_tig00110865pilonHSYRG00345 [Hibiscus syriacus]
MVRTRNQKNQGAPPPLNLRGRHRHAPPVVIDVPSDSNPLPTPPPPQRGAQRPQGSPPRIATHAPKITAFPHSFDCSSFHRYATGSSTARPSNPSSPTTLTFYYMPSGLRTSSMLNVESPSFITLEQPEVPPKEVLQGYLNFDGYDVRSFDSIRHRRMSLNDLNFSMGFVTDVMDHDYLTSLRKIPHDFDTGMAYKELTGLVGIQFDAQLPKRGIFKIPLSAIYTGSLPTNNLAEVLSYLLLSSSRRGRGLGRH